MKLLKKFFDFYIKQIILSVRLSVCLFLGLILLLALFLLWDVRFMSNKEVLACLTRIYGQEFSIQSSRSLAEDERAEGLWRVKLYEVIPLEEPERQFWAFNIVKSESGGIFGASNGLRDTYALDILAEVFAEQAAAAGLTYSLKYSNYPFRSQTDYYAQLFIDIEPVSAENLTPLCRVLAQSFAEVLARIPSVNGYFANVRFGIIYREPDWPEQEVCRVYLEPFYKLPEGEAALRELIQKSVDNYVEKNNLNK